MDADTKRSVWGAYGATSSTPIEDLDDARGLDLGGRRASFKWRSDDALSAGVLGQEHLYSNGGGGLAADMVLPRQVHGAHASGIQLRNDLVVAKPGARLELAPNVRHALAPVMRLVRAAALIDVAVGELFDSTSCRDPAYGFFIGS